MAENTAPSTGVSPICQFLKLDLLRREGLCPWLRTILQTDAEVESKIRLQQEINMQLMVLNKWKEQQEANKRHKAATKLQKLYRRWRAEKERQAKRNAALKFQMLFRAWKARENFTTFMTQETPPLTVIQKFSHLLNPADFTIQEIELNMLRSEVASKLKETEQQREELSIIEKEVTTLVEGNILLRDVVSTFKKLKRSNRSKILQAITSKKKQACQVKKRREMIASYEHLFYYLQTEPMYFSRLICQMSVHDHAIELADRLLTSLYKSASTPREEYHLLRLMEATLRAEIQKKCDNCIRYDELMTLTTVNRLYLKDNKYRSVIQALKPAIQEILNHNSALSPGYDEFTNSQIRLSKIQRVLLYFSKKATVKQEDSSFFRTDHLLQCILSSVNCIPYGIRYMARVLQQSLHDQLPWASKDTVLRTVGTFLYNYLQPAIENPDAFGLISPQQYSNSVQKQNLMAVSKLIRLAMNPFQSNRNFVPEVEDYIQKTTPRFKSFFGDLLNVLEPGKYLGMNRFSDATSITKPVIQIPAEDVIYAHTLLANYQSVVFPDDADVAYQVFKTIGPVPKIQNLLHAPHGEAETRTEICLHLSGKFHLPEEFDGQVENLASATKKLILDVIRVQPGETLHEVLSTPASAAEEEEHKALMENTTFIGAKVIKSNIMEDHHLSLKDKKKQIQRNMEVLQGAGLVEDSMDYDRMLSKISTDIRMKHELREQRKTEITMLRQAAHDLSAISKELQDHIDMHRKYKESSINIFACQRLHTDGEIQRIQYAEDWFWKGKTIQYTAKELFRKGVIVETFERRRNLRKQVLTITFYEGNFQVQLGNSTVLLPILDLLTLHDSRYPIMNMFHYMLDTSMFLFLLCTKNFVI